MADTNSIRRDCRVCDSALSGLQKMYCAPSCKLNAWIEANPDRHAQHRAAYAVSPKARARAEAKKAMNAERLALARIAANWRPAQRPENYYERMLRYHRDTARINICNACGAQYCPLYGASAASLCMPCRIDSDKVSARADKARRRARILGCDSEQVDPFKVFDRDKWRCALCGVKTPRALRGTYDDRAPELDHIIPLSLGGPHTYINTQCACRRCNNKKSNKPMGQMLIFG
jgi:5-methylcytosine-specific restriction endonuclease McrA